MELTESGAQNEALQLLTPLAASGNAEARLLIAALHLDRREFDAAEPLLRDLAAQEDTAAMYYLGAICRMRDRDEAAARRWFRSGADRGHTQCMFEVGTWSFREGDLNSARYWLGRAAAAGAVNAMLNLGSVLLANDDDDGAQMWWQRAAEQGNEKERHVAKEILRANFPS
jgi:TPR repeat protein